MMRPWHAPLLGFALWVPAGNLPAQTWGTLRYSNQAPPFLMTHIHQVNPCHNALALLGNAPDDVPAGEVDYSDMPVVTGAGYSVELWAGRTTDLLGMNPVEGSRRTLRPGSSTFLPVTLPIPGWGPGERPYLQLRAWNNQGGLLTSFAEALKADPGVGSSAVFQSDPLGGQTPDGLFVLPPILSGLRSFNLLLFGDLTPIFSFSNSADSEWGSDGPVYDVDGTTPLSGDAYQAALYVGKSTESEDAWVPIPMEPVGFGQGAHAGYWQARTIPARWYDPGIYQRTCFPGTNWFQARVWERAFGATYEEARIRGGRTGASAEVPWAYVADVGGFRPVASRWPSFKLVQNPAFRITSARLLGSPELELRLSGPTGRDCVLEASDNLSTWTAVRTNRFVDGATTFTDHVSSGRSRRLYRATIQPAP